MDALFGTFYNPVSSNQNLGNGLQEYHESANTDFAPTNLEHPSDSSSSLTPGSNEGSVDSGDCNLPMFKYISDILLEEDLEGQSCMLQDGLALQAAEKSFYDALNQKDAPLSTHPPFSAYQSVENSDRGFHIDNGSIAGFHSSTGPIAGFDSSNGSIAAELDWVWNSSEASHVQSFLVDSLSDSLSVSDPFSAMQNLGNFTGAVGEGINSIPDGKVEIIDLDKYQLMPRGCDQSPPGPNTLITNLATEPKNVGYDSTKKKTNRSKGKKSHQREDDHFPEEGRSNKQSATSADDSDAQEMFDKVLLSQDVNHESDYCSLDESLKAEGNKKFQQKKQPKGSKTTRLKKQNSNREVVDLCKLLTECAQAVASYDQQSAGELMKQIRQHTSPYGDATQRLGHYFADGLEARLAGTKLPSYAPLINVKTPATEILKAYQVLVTACPFKKMVHFFANRTIMKLTVKATRLHIIDFGISYGFQWPCLIQSLSEKNGGPPLLRITAIEVPQPGFRPAAKLEETGRRLEKYCQKYGVPFEYSVLAKKWETIQLEDLVIARNEATVVNCMHRLKHMPDETVMVNNPRDAVLNLIKRINPDLFLHGVVNGTYNAPAFVTRFKQALFHFYAMFDMYEATVPREDEHRLLFERAIFGRDIINVVACEGLERVERPETYRQWQARYLRAGFKQLPLDQELLKKVKAMSKVMGYHNDFRIEDDGDWMLQGWKGRIIIALSALKPA